MFKITSACLILYLIGVTIFHSTCSLPFFPPYIVCMRSKMVQEIPVFNREILSWQNYKLLLVIPVTLIIGANIHFDFQDISIVNHYSPLRTSIISGLFIVNLILEETFVIPLECGIQIFIGILLGIFLFKGPIIAIWTHHQLKQKSLKNPPPNEMNEVELNSICN